MTNPNQKLGEWLLRGVLDLKEGELLTYEKLERVGLDSVVVYKIADREYGIDFTKTGAYDELLKQRNIGKNEGYAEEE